MQYTYAQLEAMPTARLRVLQFAYFCLLRGLRDGDAGIVYLALMQRDITRIFQARNARIFGDECLLRTNSDPRWRLADNRRGLSNDA